jgi:predicted GNAT superfamily acetyltransferase
MRTAGDQPEVRPLVTMDEIGEAVALLAEIWGEPGPMSAELLRAIGHAGGYASGAWVDGVLVGASAGFLARHDGVVLLHSHISGVRPGLEGGGVGYALKLHQRAWAMEQGVSTIEWTFDPLVRRNAYFNLGKLGATIVDFELEFYGSMRDALNAGDASDRAIVRWTVERPPSGGIGQPEVILSCGSDGGPVVTAADGPVLRAWIPEDHVGMRSAEPDLARRWRGALRDSFGRAVQDGYVAVDMTRDGWYTLVRRAP